MSNFRTSGEIFLLSILHSDMIKREIGSDIAQNSQRTSSDMKPSSQSKYDGHFG